MSRTLLLCTFCVEGNRGGFKGGAGGTRPSPFFCNNLFFCNHFEELQNVLFEVELIINNKPLTNVYPKTIRNTHSFVICQKITIYSSNTTSTVVRNLTVLSSTTDKINLINNHFLDRWRHEYIVYLRETQRTSK